MLTGAVGGVGIDLPQSSVEFSVYIDSECIGIHPFRIAYGLNRSSRIGRGIVVTTIVTIQCRVDYILYLRVRSRQMLPIKQPKLIDELCFQLLSDSYRCWVLRENASDQNSEVRPLLVATVRQVK